MDMLHVAVGGHTLAVVERDDTRDLATGCALTGSLRGLRANAEANGLTVAQADVRELRWEDQPEPELQEDVVLMSDAFYDPEDMPAMAATLRGVWRYRDGGTVGWAASEVRDGVQDCMDVLWEQGFKVAEVDRVTRSPLSPSIASNADNHRGLTSHYAELLTEPPSPLTFPFS